MFGRPKGPIGLLAGGGDLPLIFAEALSESGRPLVVFGVDGLTDRRLSCPGRECHFFPMGAVANLGGLLRRSGIREVVITGSLPKKRIYDPSLKLDQDSQRLLTAPQERGDDRLMRAFGVYLKVKAGVAVVDPRRYLKHLVAPKGLLTRRAPTAAEWKDLRLGQKAAKVIGRMDIGQTVVVKEGVIVAVEAIEGTDAAIRRAGELAREGAVVVKTSKPGQDLRFDLPCVGEATVVSMKAAGASVLGIEAGKTLMISREKLLAAADRENLSIVGL